MECLRRTWPLALPIFGPDRSKTFLIKWPPPTIGPSILFTFRRHFWWLQYNAISTQLIFQIKWSDLKEIKELMRKEGREIKTASETRYVWLYSIWAVHHMVSRKKLITNISWPISLFLQKNKNKQTNKQGSLGLV